MIEIAHMTLAELLREVQHLGGDPETTTFAIVGSGPVLMCEFELIRVDGALVVQFDWDEDE